MTDLLTALGLVLVVEGLLFAVFPTLTKRSMQTASEMPAEQLRSAGIIAAVIGVVVVYAIRVWLR